MDPNENLREQLEIAESLLGEADELETRQAAEKADRLAELVVALDSWLSRGGFLPGSWRPLERLACPLVYESMFRQLSPTEEEKFRKWARDNFDPNDTPNLAWHPVVRDEWERLADQRAIGL